jgi:hypothetical protein
MIIIYIYFVGVSFSLEKMFLLTCPEFGRTSPSKEDLPIPGRDREGELYVSWRHGKTKDTHRSGKFIYRQKII